MNYFAAKRTKELLTDFRRVLLSYWDARKTFDYAHLEHERGRGLRPKREPVEALRIDLNRRANEISRLVGDLRISTLISLPGHGQRSLFTVGLDVGGAGDHETHKTLILDGIDRCIGAADAEVGLRWRRLVRPWYWPFDLVVAITHLPLAIMRAAGWPRSVEEHVLIRVAGIVLAVFWIGVLYLVVPSLVLLALARSIYRF